MSVSAETPTFLLLGVVIILILMAVGIFVLTLVYLRRGQTKNPPAPEERASPAPGQDPPAELDAAETLAAAPQPEIERPPAALYSPAQPGEVMRVIRDQKTGRIVVQVEGQSYTHIREIHDAQVGRRVLWAIADLLRFTGGMAANPQAVRSVVQAPAEPAAPPAEKAASADPLPPASAPVSDSAGSQPNQRYSMVDFFRRGFQPEPAASELQPSSFIDEIEALLQASIEARSSPLSQVVHVKTASDGSLQIEVGLQVYSSPDDVPDPEIRDLIKAAVAEWERR